VNYLWNTLFSYIHHQIWSLRRFIGIADAGEVLDFTGSRLDIDTSPIGFLTVFQRRGDMDKEEVTLLHLPTAGQSRVQLRVKTRVVLVVMQ